MSTENNQGPIGSETVARLLKSVNAISPKEQDPFYVLAEKLFNKLSSMYSSPYFPNRDEQDDCIEALQKALKDGVKPQLMLLKMSQLEKMTDFKTKISNVIIGKFWEKEYVKPIPYHEYDPKKFL